MYITVTKGSTPACTGLVNYLSKEDGSRDFAEYLTKEDRINGEREGFFNGSGDHIEKGAVIDGIDNNTSKLSKEETRFYSLTINPSSKELEHIGRIAYREALKIEQSASGQKFWDAEKEITKNLLKEYTTRVMDEYARNFGREGLESNKDLVWYGKVEQDRYWKYNDKEVQENKKTDRNIARVEKDKKLTDIQREIKIAQLRKEYILESDCRKNGKDIPIREMMPKNGNNYHIHVIVSRKDKEQKYKLSPLAKARSNDSHKIDGKQCKIGFDRNNFAQQTETRFDSTFEYKRAWRESLEAYKLAKENPELYKEKVKEEIQKEYKERQQERSRQNDRSLQRSAERAGVSVLYNVANAAGMK
ncbi:MAG: MobB family relaxase [Lacrimispora sphenoides]